MVPPTPTNTRINRWLLYLTHNTLIYSSMCIICICHHNQNEFSNGYREKNVLCTKYSYLIICLIDWIEYILYHYEIHTFKHNQIIRLKHFFQYNVEEIFFYYRTVATWKLVCNLLKTNVWLFYAKFTLIWSTVVRNWTN